MKIRSLLVAFVLLVMVLPCSALSYFSGKNNLPGLVIEPTSFIQQSTTYGTAIRLFPKLYGNDTFLVSPSDLKSTSDKVSAGWELQIMKKVIDLKDGDLRIRPEKKGIFVEILKGGKVIDYFVLNQKGHEVSIWHNIKPNGK